MDQEPRVSSGDSRDLALVLPGGGARGAYQAGVLAALGERWGEDFPFPIITGVSAGAINAAYLASRADPLSRVGPDLCQAWLRLTSSRVFRSEVRFLLLGLFRWLWMLARGTHGSPRARSLLDTRPLHHYLTENFQPRVLEQNVERGRLRALGLTATSYATGQTVTFVQGAADLQSWERAGRRSLSTRIGVGHIMASCALPIIFPAIPVEGEYYGDGSLRQAAPLAPAIHLGGRRLLAVSVRYARSREEARERQVEGYPPPAQILGMIFNAIFLDALEIDAERLQRINRTLRLLPAPSHPEGLRPLELLVLRPSRDLGKLALDLERHLPRGLRMLTRALGASQSRTSDFLSYLLFEPPYLERLIELGYRDTLARWEEVGPFLGA